ncbi:tRNA uridine-5-carboxymethylaminomethyl(34) synthesis GTPase MnmE [Sphingomonas piscis]|uniref:tRNA modification GTPase MnmE n=1 Tax=Sphingomonas piscis TaxID=2714943 RepID=A0A6G7YTD5_9SPHN|nr:tRNA uridine-5-carboxymethylaminomethyl(34) synthesis GTPase MnmE [Sphingomonas piscis]
MPTIYALASGRPPAAIALIRVSGPLAHRAGRSIAGDLPEARRAAVRLLHSPSGDLLDEALVLRFDGPFSATGEDVVEFHCHGGRAVVDGILNALSEQDGLRIAQPGEFTRRAFDNGRIDLTEAEGLADLLEAETESQRKSALAMAEGGLRREVDRWQRELLQLSARAEAAIDYVDEDDVDSDPALAADCAALAAEWKAWLERPRAEPLKDGVRVVIAGPPNTGKSSLFNTILQSERAIVTDVPGTTRDQIEAPVAIGGVPLILVDTAGLRDADDVVERIGIQKAQQAAERADILWWLGDPLDCPAHSHKILILSRSDLVAPDSSSGTRVLRVSNATGDGVAELLERTLAITKQLLPIEGAVALNRRQAVELGAAMAAINDVGFSDVVIAAEGLRAARAAFYRLTGRAGVEEVLDHLFGRFCLGK